MAKPEWGIKRVCQNCGARFYDLRREPITCPACNTAFDPERQPKSRRTGTVARPEPVVAEVATPENETSQDQAPAVETAEEADDTDLTEDDENLEEVDSESQDLIEDTSDLGEDDDDIGEVIEHIDDEMEDKT